MAEPEKLDDDEDWTRFGKWLGMLGQRFESQSFPMSSFGVGMEMDGRGSDVAADSSSTCGQDDDDDEPEKIEEPLPWTRDHDHTRNKSCRFEPQWRHG